MQAVLTELQVVPGSAGCWLAASGPRSRLEQAVAGPEIDLRTETMFACLARLAPL